MFASPLICGPVARASTETPKTPAALHALDQRMLWMLSGACAGMPAAISAPTAASTRGELPPCFSPR